MHQDGMMNGISVLKYADMVLTGAYDQEKHSDNFFRSGAGLIGVLKSSVVLNKEQKQQILESWRDSITNLFKLGCFRAYKHKIIRK